MSRDVVKEERESSFYDTHTTFSDVFVFVVFLYLSRRRGRVVFSNAHKTFSGETGCLRLFARSFAGTDFKEADVFVHSERGLRVQDGESER